MLLQLGSDGLVAAYDGATLFWGFRFRAHGLNSIVAELLHAVQIVVLDGPGLNPAP